MLAAAAATVLALVSPLVGQTYDNRVDRPSEPTAAPTVLDPRTLRPVEDAPRLPGADQVEVSPAGDRIVGLKPGGLVFASLRSGRELGRMSLVTGPKPVLSWIAPDRLLVVSCSDDDIWYALCSETRVRVVDPVRRVLVGEPIALRGQALASRAGSRQLLVLTRPDSFGTGNTTTSTAAVVLDSRGAIQHRFELPELAWVVSLDRTLITSRSEDDRQQLFLRIDVARGRVAERRARAMLNRREWLLPSPRGRAVLTDYCSCRRLYPFDRSSLASLGVPLELPGTALASRSGYLTVRDGKDRDTLVHHDHDGRRRWTRVTPEGSYVRVIGPYVYVQWTEPVADPDQPTRRFWIDVHRLRDGTRVTRRRGRFDLTVPSQGRSKEQVPSLASSDEFLFGN